MKEEDKIKSAEQDVFELESYINDIWQFLPIPIAYLNPLGIILDIDQIVPELLGYSKEEILGKRLIDFSQNKERLKEIEKETIKKGFVKNQEASLINKEGKEITVNISTLIRKDENGEIIGFFISLFDITERKRAEEERIKLAEEFKRTLQSLQSQIFRYRRRKDGEFVAVISEGKLAEKFNLKTEQIAGKTLSEVVGKEAVPLLYPYYERAFGGELVKFDVDFRGVWFSTVLAPFERLQDGTVVEIIGWVEDITERKETEDQLKKKMAELEEFHNLAVGRELRMIELEKEIKTLKRQVGGE